MIYFDVWYFSGGREANNLRIRIYMGEAFFGKTLYKQSIANFKPNSTTCSNGHS